MNDRYSSYKHRKWGRKIDETVKEILQKMHDSLPLGRRKNAQEAINHHEEFMKDEQDSNNSEAN